MLDEYSDVGLVDTDGDFLRCPKCRGSNLHMNTTNMSHGIVYDKDGVIMEFDCIDCSHSAILAIGNGDVGKQQLIARISWVHKVAPYVPTAAAKLAACSLTGYSKKLKQHAEKYDLWDVAIGSKADVPFDPKEYATKKC
tara:strand:+ start:3739 stop:4155 length:417 start_codon:yes stop_codon:yes gene_type:complete